MRGQKSSFYLLYAHAASLRGVSDKWRPLREGGAVAVTAIYLDTKTEFKSENQFTNLTFYLWNLQSKRLVFLSFVWLFSYPADVLALRSRREGLGADDGVPPHEGVLLVDIRPALLWSNHRAVMRRQQAVHARLLVDLDKGKRLWSASLNLFWNGKWWTLKAV